MAHSPTRPLPHYPEPLDILSNTDVEKHGVSPDHRSPPARAEPVATWNPDQESPIHRLPIELLITIVELAVLDSAVYPVEGGSCEDEGCTECDRACNTPNAKTLCLVSSTFRNIAQPLLFRVLNLTSLERSSRMRHTLSENVYLRKHCRRVSIVIGLSPNKAGFPVWRDVLCYLANAKCIQLHGMTHSDEEEEIMKGLATHADRLEHLFLSGGYWSSAFFRLINGTTDFSRLMTLNIGCDGSHEPLDHLPSLARVKKRTSPITSLAIINEDQDPESSSTLIAWSKALEKFAYITCGMGTENAALLLFLTDLLLVHAETLKSVDITHVVKVSNLFNATLFPNLEFLRLSRWHMEGPLVFNQEYAKILGPRLKTLVWNFKDHAFVQGYLLLDNFGEDEETWLRELVTAAADSELSQVQVEFTPVRNKLMTWYVYDSGAAYPWDRMDNVRDSIMQQVGISLTYNKPSISKQQWLGYTDDWGPEELIGGESDAGLDEEVEEETGEDTTSEVDSEVDSEEFEYLQVESEGFGSEGSRSEEPSSGGSEAEEIESE